MSLAPPPNKTALWGRIAFLVLVGIIAIFVARYLLTRPASFEGNGISLNYPREWEPVLGSYSPPTAIELLWVQGFSLDEVNGVGVAAANIGTAIPAAFFETAARGQLEPQIEEIVSSLGGTLSGPTTTEIADRVAVAYEASNLAMPGGVTTVTLYAFPDGSTVYFIACQKTPARVAEVDAGCDLIRDSFSI